MPVTLFVGPDELDHFDLLDVVPFRAYLGAEYDPQYPDRATRF